MNKLIFIPTYQRYMETDYKLYEIGFQVGFIPFTLYLLDTTRLPELSKIKKTKVKPKYEYIQKRYMCVLSINKFYWIWHATDNPDTSETHFRKVQSSLQQGESVIFTHLGNLTKSIRLSWRGIEFEW